MGILALIGFLLFIKLGFWQLARAHEKKTMLTTEALFAARPSKLWLGGQDDVEAFQRIHFTGNLLPQVMLLDNQYYHHQIGYHVIMPVLMSSGWIVLVDSGWVAADVTRQTLPDVSVSSGVVDISGTVYQPVKKTWLLGPMLEKQQSNRMVIESLDYQWMAQTLHHAVYPFIIRLDSNSALCHVCDWVTVVMSPTRHIGYAFQWFALACLVCVLFIGLNSRKS